MGANMLSKTCRDEEFFKVFKELKHNQSLELPNNNKLEMYYTKIMNNKFDYSGLSELLSNNITNYVFSRKENLEASEKNKIQNLKNLEKSKMKMIMEVGEN